MTPTQIAARVRNRFGDTRGSIIKDDLIIDGINEACVEIVRETLCLVDSNTGAASGFRSGTGFPVGDPFIVIREVIYDTRPLALIDKETISRMGYWVLPDGVPEAYYLEGTRIYLFPNPASTDTTTCTVTFVPMPAVITALIDTIPIPENLHGDVAEFCLALAHERNENWRGAENSRKIFNQNISRRKYEMQSQDDTYRVIAPDIMDQDFIIGYWQ